MIHIHISRVKWLCSLFALTSFHVLFAQGELSFLYVGDIMQHDGQIQAAYNKETDTYEYDDAFAFIKPILLQHDLRIANLEVTLAGKPYKGYPQFSGPDELASAIIRSGFNVILTANNHSCDRGEKGVVRTLDILDELGVMHTGTFRNKDERERNYPLMIEQKGIKIALLNYTYGTNGIFVDPPLIVNYIDKELIRRDVEKAKQKGAEYIICTMHWGTEYQHLPDSYEKEYESFCYSLGIDQVIGNHPHVVQPIERKLVSGKEKLTVWSLGNFVSNMQTRPTRGGLMVSTALTKKEMNVTLSDAAYWLVYVMARQEGAVKYYYVLPDYPYNDYRSDFLLSEDRQRMSDFLSDSRTLFKQHNKQIEERMVEKGSALDQHYQLILSGYYSVLLEGADEALLRDSILGAYLYKSLGHDGKRAILSGMYADKSEALGQLRFLNDCKVDLPLNVVFIRNGKLTKEE